MRSNHALRIVTPSVAFGRIDELPKLKAVFFEALSSRGQLFDLIYDLKWIILTAFFASLILYLPAQVRELYRIMFGDASTIEIVLLFASVSSISAMAWFSSGTVANSRIADPPTTGPLVRGRLASSILGSVPFVGCGAGLWGARVGELPGNLKFQLSELGSPWEDTAQELADALGTSLPIASLVCFVLAFLCFVFGYWTYLRVGRVFRYANSRTFFGAILPLTTSP